jgi:hypothetical protein
MTRKEKYMTDTNHKISYFGPKPARTVQRTVQKQLDKWIERKKSAHSLNKESHYQVRFEQTPEVKGCFCHYRIQIGTCTWEGYDVGRSIEESLHLALRHPTVSFLRPESRIQYFNPVQPTTGHAA